MESRLINVFCRSGANEWRRVSCHGANGLDVENQAVTFRDAWEAKPRGIRFPSNDGLTRLSWQDLLVPLPELRDLAWAYALTYPVHQQEVRLVDIFFFEKRGAAQGTWNPIPHRPALDYEAEVGLLLHRVEPERFGFLMANDLTDRSIQVHTHDRRNPAPGFSGAKSFPGALRVGPLLAIGGADLWPDLEIRLEVNGKQRQHLQACDCLLTPREFHQQVFASTQTADWVLALTGTTGGTIFQSPSTRQRMGLLARSGFSVKRARNEWLRRFQFLRVGDRLDMKSEILGTSYATIVAGAE